MWHPGWEGSLGENGYIYIRMAESLRCSPETITALFIGYTPIQNLKVQKKITCREFPGGPVVRAHGLPLQGVHVG